MFIAVEKIDDRLYPVVKEDGSLRVFKTYQEYLNFLKEVGVGSFMVAEIL